MLSGGLAEESAYYRTMVTSLLNRRLPDCDPGLAAVRGTDAVVHLARMESVPNDVRVFTSADRPAKRPTERRGSDGIPLDELSAAGIAARMSAADRRAVDAVAERAEDVAEAISLVATALERGGRIVYVGAGTSGRLGILDASECPPTFGVAADSVVGLIAGGDRALRTSIEGAEDDREQGRGDLKSLQPPISDRDVVVGVTASGTTPYVRAALEYGASAGAPTILLCCNPMARAAADVVIDLDTGPETLPGSTRLKAGTATKVVLNQISTGAMALSGRVFDGRMVGVRPVNRKLRGRCIEIIAELADVDRSTAEVLLDEADGNIPLAVLMHRTQTTRESAEALLKRTGGKLREALDA